MATERVLLADLRLDTLNPRLGERQQTEREAIRLLVIEGGSRFLKLMRSVREQGFFEGELPIVLREPGAARTVIEGNRRTAALKLMAHPEVAENLAGFPTIKRLSAGSVVPERILCSVVDSREEARPWQILRHNGEAEGAGIVNWSTEARQRFFGGHGDRAWGLAWAKVMRKELANDPAGLAQVEKTMKAPTTVGRVLQMPEAQEGFGLDLTEGAELVFKRPLAEIMPAFLEMLRAFSTREETARTLNATREKQAFVARLVGLASGGDGAGPTRRRERAATTPSPFVLRGLKVASLLPRTQDCLRELQGINLAQKPNVVGIMLRAVLEMAVTELCVEKSWASERDSLEDKVKACLKVLDPELDPKKQNPKYEGIRLGILQKDGLYSARTLHGYVHNAMFHPQPADLRAIAGNLKLFLADVNDLR